MLTTSPEISTAWDRLPSTKSLQVAPWSRYSRERAVPGHCHCTGKVVVVAEVCDRHARIDKILTAVPVVVVGVFIDDRVRAVVCLSKYDGWLDGVDDFDGAVLRDLVSGF